MPCLLGLLLFALLPATEAAQVQVLPGHVPSLASRQQAIGRLNPAQSLDLAIGLPLRNKEALIALLNEIYDPRSAQYHQYLTPDEFAEAFGPSPQQYQAVVAFAQAHRLAVTRTHSNRVLLDVTGSVADIQAAFGLNLVLYRHPSENRLFYAPDADPVVDSTVPILDITGLDNFRPPRPLLHFPNASAAGAHPLNGSGAGGTYLGKDFRAAYAANVAVTGLGQTVGLLEFDGYYANDITSYESQAGLPNVPLSNVLLDGFNGSPGGANIEVALDIEMAVAMAPGLSKVIVYEAGPNGFPNDILNRMASDNSARQLSSSWSWSGGPSSTTDNIFLQFAAQGQSFFQASGDSGAYVGAVPQPCDSPYLTIVGGTTLSTTGPGGAWTAEKVWNWNNNNSGTNASSGGISTTYSIPSWQAGVSMSANQGSSTMRNLPDVAMTADNILVTYDNGSSGVVGGTSCAAPLWAAYAALINQQLLANSNTVIGFLNPALYSIAQSSAYSTTFHDVTTGNNTNTASPTRFSAASGYDLCTGWGTPAGSALINALAGPPMANVVSNSLALALESCTNNAVDPGETVTMNFGLSNIGSANTANLVATLQTGGGVTSPSGPQTYGALVAGAGAVTRPFTFTASGNCGGIVTATLQLQDGASNLGTVTFTIRLGAVSTVTTFSENFDGTTAPALPAGWSSAVGSGFLSAWATTNGFSDSAPNSVFAPDGASAGESELVSPVIPIQSSTAQLTFRQNYNLAFHSTTHPRTTTYYNGGVLQISIGGGAFTDIVSAGGSFAVGGYNCTLASGTANPLSGSPAWGGSSGGWVTTTVLLPASAAGQSVQLKWALQTGINAFVGTGWFVDSISLQDSTFDCCAPSADVGVSQSATPNPAGVGQNLTYTLTITNGGPSAASSLAVTDALPSNVTFVSASPGCLNLGNSIACTIGRLNAGGFSNILVTVKPSITGILTNVVSVTSTPSDPNIGNNNAVSMVAVQAPPAITSQPTNQVATAGGNANFYASASGTTPLNYQWTFGGAPLAGATGASLALANVQPAQAGNYAVIVTNGVGSVTSVVATLTVLVPPAITLQPTNETVAVGASSVFQVGATGTSPLSYQWMFNGTPLNGASSSSLAQNNVQTNQAGNYCVIVTNSAGSLTSAVVALTVLVPPSITLQPTNQTTVPGSNITFQAAASGSSQLKYQWFFGGGALSGQTSTSLTLANVQSAQAGSYQFVATNSAGAATSAVAQLTVLMPPVISAQPTNALVIAGAKATFQVSASGSPPLAYQWWFNDTNALGTNGDVLVLTNVQSTAAGGYNVVITNNAGAVTSVVATLTIGIPPGISQQPSSLTVTQSQAASFSVTATGDTPLTYQWRFNGAPISGGTASAYTLSGTTPANAGNYDVVVSNIYGTMTSAVAQLTVLVPPSINSQPTNQTATAGSTAVFQVSAAGTAPLAYQWWFNGTNAVGADTNVLTIPSAGTNSAGGYSVVLTNAAGAVTSSVAQLTVLVPPSIVMQPTDQTSPMGGSASFATAAAGSAPLTYQWSFNGTAIPGATSNVLALASIQPNQAGSYTLVVNNSAGSAASSTASLRVLIPPLAGSPVPNASGFSVSVSSVAGLNYLLEYKNALQDPSWTPTSAWYSGTGGILGLQDTNAPSATRFYRVRCQ